MSNRSKAKGESFRVAYWSQKFGVPAERLQEGAAAADDFAATVDAYLKEAASWTGPEPE